MPEQFDCIVIGAGPAGSTAARNLALGGARVLLIDKAKFPRDKPCGGGLTFRADDANDLDLSPVTEREIFGIRVSINMGRRFERTTPRLLARMTQRSRLDAFLAQRAAESGADFRDGVTVRTIEIEGAMARVRTDRDTFESRVLIGTDGVNGVTATALGLAPQSEVAVAFEANYPADERLMNDWSQFIGMDLAGTPGGYAWVFPKGDHLNVGVGGWKYLGPTLRARLSKYCGYYGFDESRLFGHRGYQLPLRRDNADVVRGPAMLAGDAAGLVDPLSGEGIWAAFVSGRIAAEQAQRYLSGEIENLRPYQHALNAVMHDEILASRRLQAIQQRLPGFSVLMLKYDRFWRYMTEIIRGELTYPDLQKKLGPLKWAMDGWADREIHAHQQLNARPRERSAANVRA